jgi:ABC-2 type transport system permease protein
MRGFGSVFRKELYVLFASPIFYVVACMFLVLSGYFFYSAIAYFNLLSFQASQNPFLAKQLNLTEMVVRPFFLDMSIILLLISPLLTMRLYAEERKTGTLELLFTLPISDFATLLAKYGAVVASWAVLLVGTLPGFVLLYLVSNPSWTAVCCGYLGIFLLGASFLALGIFTSSLTQNQIIAAVLSFGLLLMFWIIGWVKNLVGPVAAQLVDYFSTTSHFDSFAKGVIDSGDLVYYLLFAALFLFLSLRQMESYRWRG